MSSASDGDGGRTETGVGTTLTTLVPTFDPSKDNLQIYTQKVELVLAAWPKSKITELVMRLILKCQGSAFAKLQLHQAELMTNDEKAVRRVIELLGGHWGRIGLERQYEEAEQALYSTVQMKDESNDSFLARADIAWSKFLSQKLPMEDLQAFVLLRGSTLTPEEKKVILESDNSLEGKLTVTKVLEAIRILGATFFQEMTGQKVTSKQKVYSSSTLVTEHEEDEEPAFLAHDEHGEDEFMETLLMEGDVDAALVADFESAATELLQEDNELASAYSAYTEARRRLTEKFKNRGFWSTSKSSFTASKGKGSYAKGSHKGKSNWNQKPRRSLQDRILNSYCRNCNRKGHWKAECPYKMSGASTTGSSSTPSTASGSLPTTTVSVEGHEDVMPLEFLHLPTIGQETIDDTFPVLVSFGNAHQDVRPNCHRMIQGESNWDKWDKGDNPITAKERLRSWGLRSESREPNLRACRAKPLSSSFAERMRHRLNHASCPPEHQEHVPSMSQAPGQGKPTVDMSTPPEDATACFASYGSHGILDLGASKTVIGSSHLGDLIRSLDADVRQRLSKCPCHIVFKFGNQSTLTSQEALVVPIGSLLLKIAIVPGGTPFLLSNTLMRTLRATIDCATQSLSSPMMSRPGSFQLTPKGLFLLDLNEIINAAMDGPSTSRRAGDQSCTETYLSEVSGKIMQLSSETDQLKCQDDKPNMDPPGIKAIQVDQGSSERDSKSQDVSNAVATKTNDQNAVAPRGEKVAEPSDQHISPISHVAVTETPSAASALHDADCERGPPDLGGTPRRDSDVWTEVQRKLLRGDVAGSRMGPVHDQSLP